MNTIKRGCFAWFFAGLWGLAFMAPSVAAAADYTQGVDATGAGATIWFSSNVNTSWVDVHYQVNGGGQQNLRMGRAASGRFEQATSAPTGASLNYFFTYTNNGLAYDTPRFTATVGSGPVAATGAVCFFEHVAYGGASLCADADSGFIGAAWNDRASSVKVRAGTQLDLYEHSNYAGRALSLTADTPDLVARGFNDLTSSFRLRAAGTVDLPTGNGVMTVKLANATGGTYADAQIFWAVIGYDPATKRLAHVDRNGTLQPAAVADNDAPGHVVKGGQNYANYFNRLSDVGWLSLPRIDSARLFISVGTPMFIKVNSAPDGRIGFAGPNLGNPTDPNQDVIFEWVEFTLDAYGYHGNTTRVDQFGFPLRARLVGKDGYDRTLGETQSRAQIFADFEGLPAEWRSLVKRPFRIVAPGKDAFGAAGAQARYFDGYVNQVWSHYAANELVFTAEAGTFRGRVVGNDFVFAKDGGPGGLTIRGKPTSTGIFEASGNLASGSSQELVVQAQIAAAFNRHLLIAVDPGQWSNAAAYYPQGPANYYAKFWHDHSLEGLAYGFAYDDVRNKSTLMEHPDPKGLIVTVGW
jgi:Beta-1,3-glucanase/Peptidase inhibitor family I36